MAVQLPEVAIKPAESGMALGYSSRWRSWRAASLRNLEIVLPAAGVVFMLLACFFGPMIFPVPGPNAGNIAVANIAPLTPGHLLGTDPLGNDVLSRILYGGRVSLEVGFGSTGLGFLIGGFLGILAGFKSGITETIVMRILDIFLALPALVLALTIATFLGASELHVIYAIACFSVPGFARIARAHTLRLREQVFVVSATLSGQKSRKILLYHLVPNVIPNLVTFGFLFVGLAILVEAALSFLGFGVPPPTPTWGNMIFVGEAYIGSNPDLVIIPAAFLFFAVMCLNLLGDGLRARWSSL